MSSSLSGQLQMDPSDSSKNFKQDKAELCFAHVVAVKAALIIGNFSAFEFFVKAFSEVEYFLYACSCSHVPESVLESVSPTRALLLGFGPDVLSASVVATYLGRLYGNVAAPSL